MRFLKIVFFSFIIIILFLVYHFTSNAPVTKDEIVRQDEPIQTQRSIDTFIKNLDADKTSYVARGAHSKGHACVKAYFNINETIQPELQHGVFAVPGKSYKSWIRFSNAKGGMKGNHDAHKDAHGMAIKLFHIYDDVLKKTDDGAETQDFLMHDSPAFFVANLEDYNQFLESEDKIMYFVAGINPFKWHLRELSHALETLKPPPVSPLWAHYFSNTAYKLGPHNIKFSAQSCSIPEMTTAQNQTDPDFLQKVMADELQVEEGCFNFMVQLQNPDKYMPIEDPSIEWKESDSPFIPIAKIRIPAQEFNSAEQHDFCENLSFSPWNSLDEHRPIGQLNRIRKEVYQASSKYRHTQNKTETPTRLNWQ
jgi:catalase